MMNSSDRIHSNIHLANEQKGTLTIVINHNRCEDTVACVKSVIESQPPNNRIAVIDNGSATDDFATIEKELGQITHVLRSESNLGVAAAWNKAIKDISVIHEPKYILLLNNDTIVDGDVISELVEFMERTACAGASSPTIVTFDSPHVLQYTHHKGITEPTVDFHLSGCALMVRRKTIEDVGTFDEDYFMYTEETDFLYRMKRTSWKPYYVPTMGKVYHKGAATSSMISGFEAFHRTRNELVFAAKNLSGKELLFFLERFFLRWLPKSIIDDLSRPSGGNSMVRRVLGAVSGIVGFPQMRLRKLHGGPPSNGLNSCREAST